MLQPTRIASRTVQNCPDCGTPLGAFFTASRDPGYVCPNHGKFIVTASSEDFGFWSAPIETQRNALRRARAVASPWEPPIVILYA